MSKILCSCQDSQGNPKQFYISEKQANDQKNFIKEDRGVLLEVYKCPEKPGWHLTKAVIETKPLRYNNNSLPNRRAIKKNTIGNSLSDKLITELKGLNS